ncbi:MAG: protein-glutamate O-methyltransferase CheR [Thermoanaerobaculia bacterium]
MLETTNNYVMSEELFRLFRDYILAQCGIYFKETNKFLLERRIMQRIKALQFQSYEQYYYYLTYDPRASQEIDLLYDVITTNETYFFREQKQLKAFIEEIVPEILSSKDKLRIWSAGCSTGEEPFSIAMLLYEYSYFSKATIDIFASDLSQDAIIKARKGIFKENSFRNCPEYYKKKYFDEISPGAFKIKDDIRQKVSFGKLNLLDTNRIYLLGYLDIIFCRNVIIYFDDKAKKRVVDMFYDRLYPQGFLLLGHSESLITITTKFKLRHFKNDMVYQK